MPDFNITDMVEVGTFLLLGIIALLVYMDGPVPPPANGEDEGGRPDE